MKTLSNFYGLRKSRYANKKTNVAKTNCAFVQNCISFTHILFIFLLDFTYFIKCIVFFVLHIILTLHYLLLIKGMCW